LQSRWSPKKDAALLRESQTQTSCPSFAQNWLSIAFLFAGSVIIADAGGKLILGLFLSEFEQKGVAKGISAGEEG
jgi:hypothetical protein